jgi:diguanylate cyclase (GGDEF)-like protein
MTTRKEDARDSGKAEGFEGEREALAARIAELIDANRRLTSTLSALRQANAELKKKTLDLTETNRQLDEEKNQLQRLALYDTLTGLGNRDLFLRQLEHLIAIADRREEEVALLALDLDGFKVINDRLGHAAGDEMLREIGVRMGLALRKADQKFRIGGDEFAVLLEPRTDAFAGARLVAEQMAERLVAPVQIRGHECSIGVSIGIAVFPQHGRESSALLRKADAAMYEAKKNELVVAGASDLGATTVLRSLHADVFHLIYVSTAVGPMSGDDLIRLLRQARTRNERLQLTGMLLYKNGRFMEVLEGTETNVRKAFADIEQDGRHKNLDVLRSERIALRNFPSWTMSFEEGDASSVPAFSGFLRQHGAPDYFDEGSVEAHAMLMAFKHAALTRP